MRKRDHLCSGEFSVKVRDYLREYLVPIILYLVITIAYFDRHVFSGLSSSYFGGSYPNFAYLSWILAYWKYQLFHLNNPFYTQLIYSHNMISMAWNPFFLPSFGIGALPLTLALGHTVTAQLILVSESVTGSFFTYLLCRRFGAKYFPALFGGYLFGFSSYVIEATVQTLPNTRAIFLLPIIIYAITKRYDRKIPPIVFVAIETLLLVILFGIFPEIFSSSVLIGGITFIIFYAYGSPSQRKEILSISIFLLYSVIVATLLLLPYAYFMIAKNYYGGSKFGWSASGLLSTFIPNIYVLLHIPGHSMWHLIGYRKGSNGAFSTSGYLGIPLIALLILYVKKYWKTFTGKTFTTIFFIIFVFSLGRYLSIEEIHSIWLPWDLTAKIPLLKDMQPHRLDAYLFLLASIMLSMYFSQVKNRFSRYFWMACIILFLIPNPLYSKGGIISAEAPFWNAQYRQYIAKRSTIIVVSNSNGMRQQADTGFYFKLANGISQGPGIHRPAKIISEIRSYLYSNVPIRDPKEFLQNLRSDKVKYIVFCRPIQKKLQHGLSEMGLTGTKVGGVILYPVKVSYQQIDTVVGSANNQPLPLMQNQNASVEILPSTYALTKAGWLRSIGVFQGNYGNTANGQLMIRACSNGSCVSGVSPLSQSKDNSYFYIILSHPLFLDPSKLLTLTIKHVGGTRPDALWLWPQMANYGQHLKGPKGNIFNKSLRIRFNVFDQPK